MECIFGSQPFQQWSQMENELSDFIVENGPNQSRSSSLKSWLDKAHWLLFFSSVPENLQFDSLALRIFEGPSATMDDESVVFEFNQETKSQLRHIHFLKTQF